MQVVNAVSLLDQPERSLRAEIAMDRHEDRVGAARRQSPASAFLLDHRPQEVLLARKATTYAVGPPFTTNRS